MICYSAQLPAIPVLLSSAHLHPGLHLHLRLHTNSNNHVRFPCPVLFPHCTPNTLVRIIHGPKSTRTRFLIPLALDPALHNTHLSG